MLGNCKIKNQEEEKVKGSFLKDFLMISHIETIGFLILLALIFFIIAKLIKKFDYSKLVIIGTIAGLLLGLVIQIFSGFADDPMKIGFVAETTKWFSLFGGGYDRYYQNVDYTTDHYLYNTRYYKLGRQHRYQ